MGEMGLMGPMGPMGLIGKMEPMGENGGYRSGVDGIDMVSVSRRRRSGGVRAREAGL